MTEQLLTSKDVQALTGIKSRATLWRKSRNADDRFPLAYKDGTHFTPLEIIGDRGVDGTT